MAGRYWKEAATLLVVGRAANSGMQKYQTDYNLLFLKRSQKSKFMPNAMVFPGGVVEKSDFSKEWLKIFKKCGYSSEDLHKQFRNNVQLPEIYLNKPVESILPEVGFRIGAIRETFEECGLLLASHQPESELSPGELQEWQKAVHADPVKFLNFFQEMGGCPAIWNLHEWSIWLTPTNMSSRRFDTAFYLTFLENIPNVVHDDKEISELQLSTPLDIIKKWRNEELWLPPPQVYEISRLLQFGQFDKLKQFAQERGKKGLERFMSVRMNLKDGVLSILPGDDLYPKKPDYIGVDDTLETDSTRQELRQQAKCLNRIEFAKKSCHMFVNIELNNGHVQPIDLKDIDRVLKSLL